jgi:hypothetical protein
MKFLVFLVMLAHADPSVTVWSRAPNAVRKFFPPERYRMLDGEDEKKQMNEEGYLLPSVRNALFHKLELEDLLAPLDEMDKDMLVMGARFETLVSLQKHYPMLKEDQLKALINEVKELAEQ